MKTFAKVILVTTFCCFAFVFQSFAQSDENQVTDMVVNINAGNYEVSKSSLVNYIKNNNFSVLTQNETDNTIYIVFFISEKASLEIDSFFNTLGFINSKNITTSNNKTKIDEIKLQIEYNNKLIADYNAELLKMNRDDRYYTYWQKIRDVESTNLALSKDLKTYELKHNYRVTITIQDDFDQLTSGKVSWVNMPGATFDMLFVESPLTLKTAERYTGYSIKYLFTKGKTYAKLTTLKAVPKLNSSDSTTLKELFLIGFGQDFYTRHFGRGKNRWLNLYSAYTLGGVYATSEAAPKAFFYMQMYIGCEILKTKYFLIDNKVGYFVPFSSYNRNLRGTTYEVAFNFVF